MPTVIQLTQLNFTLHGIASTALLSLFFFVSLVKVISYNENSAVRAQPSLI